MSYVLDGLITNVNIGEEFIVSKELASVLVKTKEKRSEYSIGIKIFGWSLSTIILTLSSLEFFGLPSKC